MQNLFLWCLSFFFGRCGRLPKSHREVVRQSAFYRNLEVDVRKAALASATLSAAVAEAREAMASLTTVAELKKVAEKLPSWLDSLRASTSQKLVTQFAGACTRLWPIVAVSKNMQEVDAFVQLLAALPTALGSRCPEALKDLEVEAREHFRKEKQRVKHELLQSTLEPFINGGTEEGQASLTPESHEVLAKVMAGESWEGLVIDEELLENINEAIIGLSWSIVRLPADQKPEQPDAETHLETSMRSLLILQDLVQDMEGLKLRSCFTSRVQIGVELTTFMVGKTAESIAQGSVVSQTHMMTLLAKCKQQVATALPVLLSEPETAVMDEILKCLHNKVSEVEEVQDKVAEICLDNQKTACAEKHTALKKLIGSPESPSTQVWSSRVPRDSSWSTLAEEAKRSLLKGDYVVKVKAGLKAVDEDFPKKEPVLAHPPACLARRRAFPW